MKTNTILTGSCIDILPTIPDKSFQLAFADPPYWVGFNYGNKTDEDMEYIDPNFLVTELLRIAECVLVTCGVANIHDYPKSSWVIAWNKPASTGRSNIKGFNIWEPVLVYGDPKKRIWQDSFTAPGGRENDADFHKCPKPVSLLTWLLNNFTDPGDKILDPVCGSGTTLKAAKQLNREYLGIEIDPNIVRLSLERLANTQPPLMTVRNITPLAQDRLIPTDE